jgi:hypothetical protein
VHFAQKSAKGTEISVKWDFELFLGACAKRDASRRYGESSPAVVPLNLERMIVACEDGTGHAGTREFAASFIRSLRECAKTTENN